MWNNEWPVFLDLIAADLFKPNLSACTENEMPLTINRSYCSSNNDVTVKPEVNDDANVFADVILVNAASGLNPSFQDWPGVYDFRINLKDPVRSRDPQVRVISL